MAFKSPEHIETLWIHFVHNNFDNNEWKNMKFCPDGQS